MNHPLALVRVGSINGFAVRWQTVCACGWMSGEASTPHNAGIHGDDHLRDVKEGSLCVL